MSKNIKKLINWLTVAVVVSIIGYIVYRTVQRWLATTYTSYDDGNTYGLRSGDDGSLKSQKLARFSEVNQRITKLVRYCCSHNYPDEHRAHRLYKRWNKSTMSETSPDEDSIAYVINKGTEFRVCLTDKKSGELEDINTTMFVCIHELGHLMSKEYGHNDEFWENNRILLKVAGNLNIYNHVQYEQNNSMYCGENIYSNPCSDASCGIDKDTFKGSKTGLCAENMK